MKLPRLSLALLSAAAMAFSAHAEDGLRDLQIGDPAPDFSLPGIDGKTHTLAEYKDAKLLMVTFLSNHCPDSHAVEARLKKFLAETRNKGLTLVAINPNSPDGLSRSTRAISSTVEARAIDGENFTASTIQGRWTPDRTSWSPTARASPTSSAPSAAPE